jgi:hypothetical protein
MQMAATGHTATPPAERLSITPRIIAIMGAIARFGVITSEQAWRLDGGSRQKCTRFLQRMVEHNLIRRADSAPDPLLTTYYDQRPRAFAITAKGLRVLREAGMPINVAPKKANVLLMHEIETAECMFAFNTAVAAHGSVRLIDQPELLALVPPGTRELAKPLRLTAEAHPSDFPQLAGVLKRPTMIGIEPDRLFALALLDNTGWTFALEWDRSTEDLDARRIKGKATYLRKALGYYAAWHQSRHLERWGEIAKSFRVLVITTNETRITNMLALQARVGAPPGLFLYTTPHRLAERGALAPIWITSKRDSVSLLDRE